MATYTVYGSQGDYLTIPSEIIQANNAKNNFWRNVGQPVELRLSPQYLSDLHDKNSLEIIVRKLQSRNNITITPVIRHIKFNVLQPLIALAVNVDIVQMVRIEGNGAIFKFIIPSSSVSFVTSSFTKELMITLGEYNDGKISLLLLEDVNSQPYVLNNIQPDSFDDIRTNPAGGVKIP